VAEQGGWAVKLPEHKGELSIVHNEHKTYYQTIEQMMRDTPDLYGTDSWVSDEERANAIATDEVWTCRWYPNTPVCFCMRSASSLEALLASFESEEP
jgi:hypothetical protein